MAELPLSQRLNSVDFVRGAVMIIMALDHTRGAWSDAQFDITDVRITTTALFLTRWITHFCAPVFVFLAGTGAFLSKKPKSELSRFLITRGLWLIFLEATWVHFGFYLNFDPRYYFAQVFWALGCSMIALAAIVHLPLRAIATFGVAMIVLHNAFDGVQGNWLWSLLHVKKRMYPVDGFTFYNAYPLIPWIGVMAAGYAFGAILRNRALLLRIGFSTIALFVVLRSVNIYGDDRPWATFSVLAFVNTEKYPPSLLFLLMTLGPAIVAIALLEKVRAGPIVIFGRVPLFFYLLHTPMIHGAAAVAAWIRYGNFAFLTHNPSPLGKYFLPPGYGYPLHIVYLVWVCVIVALYPACKWFAALKHRRRDAWLSYF